MFQSKKVINRDARKVPGIENSALGFREWKIMGNIHMYVRRGGGQIIKYMYIFLR